MTAPSVRARPFENDPANLSNLAQGARKQIPQGGAHARAGASNACLLRELRLPARLRNIATLVDSFRC